jgi:hypothetical protein
VPTRRHFICLWSYHGVRKHSEYVQSHVMLGEENQEMAAHVMEYGQSHVMLGEENQGMAAHMMESFPFAQNFIHGIIVAKCDVANPWVFGVFAGDNREFGFSNVAIFEEIASDDVIRRGPIESRGGSQRSVKFESDG